MTPELSLRPASSRWAMGLLLATLAVVALCWLAEVDVRALGQALRGSLPRPVTRFIWVTREALSSPLSYLIVLGILVLQWWIPAKPQPVLSRGLAQDFLWFNADILLQPMVMPFFAVLLHAVYDEYLGFLTIEAAAAWPHAVRVVVSLLAVDFTNWLHHVVRHKVTALWYFHTVHHSQREMNLFTDARVHIAEFVVAKAITFVPLFMLQPGHVWVFWIGFATAWYNRLYHANVRSNFGILKHVLVTPQSHRVHHSIEPRHRDRNFGTLFTIWDRLFGTLYPHYDEYPDTGVDDERFPLERHVGGLALLKNYAAQFVYPFRMLIGRG
jgi:sterol desaturase/sphingolipid hydroxylase (fatty acid hydroxylase superfamily)